MAIGKYYVAPFRWSRMVWVMSIITTIILIGSSIVTLCIPELASSKGVYVVMLLIIPLPVICFALAPRSLYLIGNTLIIKRWVGRVTIPTEEITAVEEADKWVVLRSTRTMGNGGLFGYYGHYHNRQYGKFRMFATDTSNLYLIRTHKRNFVINCSNPELIAKLREMIQK
jgi:hypothetical protein